ncbi:hypothetical protein IMCC3317_27600 [Kordia antarctica]|uniref:Uncharacterized protein n=1 Tax=Kordia antarctica TaxID=1218801 RepID=A0A7L4ZLJ8_9FLAO|nr:hypothetical protein IMCC3317_27600 [Kordia antarctica]
MRIEIISNNILLLSVFIFIVIIIAVIIYLYAFNSMKRNSKTKKRNTVDDEIEKELGKNT